MGMHAHTLITTSLFFHCVRDRIGSLLLHSLDLLRVRQDPLGGNHVQVTGVIQKHLPKTRKETSKFNNGAILGRKAYLTLALF